MIPSIHERGSETIGLIRYLYGPGTHEEHTDPHLVAAFDPLTPDPGRDSKATYEQLQRLLDQPVNALPTSRRPKNHVWHLSVRAAPEDPVLSDGDWAAIARRMVAATGIAPGGDEQACRWAAVRHADDHIHIIATLVRDDGRRPRLHNEARRAQAECRRIEADYNLRRVAPGDGTGAKRPTSAERHKAERQGRERPAREELHETVRQAVAGAASEAEFFARLQAAGLLIHQRVAPSGDLLGYRVALPGDVNDDGEPIYYAGSTLAPDLSLPRIRRRFPTTHDVHQDEQEAATRRPTARSRGAVSAPADARRSATRAAWTVLVALDQDGDGAAAARIAATGEILDTLAQTSAAHTRQQLRDAAWAFERATRSHTRAEYRHAQDLRRAARDLRYSGPALGRGEDGATTAMLIDTLFFLATAAAHWHAQRHHAQQAEAARQAAAHLRAAYAAAAEEPMARLHAQGLRLVQPVRDWAAALLHATTPEIAEPVVNEPGWPALAATLTLAYQAGHNPQELLTEAVAHRELDTAGSVSDVLVWRLRRIADLPADAVETPPTRPARHSTTASSPGATRLPGQGGAPQGHRR
ncbi:mobilization protein [Streptomyces sp. B21-097]|uniref:relaxase/mobilization nuclease domain-containing protein n=1 Tax=Streptomyces sp. B21-097 TaxID=3039414 RepID=UPI002FF18DD6